MGKIIGFVAACVAAFGVIVLLAGDLGGEVVRLETYDENLKAHETSVWVVDDHKQIWLRAGQPESSWLTRLQANPNVQLTRDGNKQSYRAVVIPKQRERINQLMAERYGWADQLIGVIRNPDTTSAIRLDPVQ